MLRELAREIGERPAFPWCRGKGDYDWNLGMTYRQFLIGKALANPNMVLGMTVNTATDNIIEITDTILERLAAEESDDH